MNPFACFAIDIEYFIDLHYVHKKYFDLAKNFHPDHGGDIKNTINLNKAYKILLDPMLRAATIFKLFKIDQVNQKLPDMDNLMLDIDKNYIESFKNMEDAFLRNEIGCAYEEWLRCRYLSKLVGSNIRSSFNKSLEKVF